MYLQRINQATKNRQWKRKGKTGKVKNEKKESEVSFSDFSRRIKNGVKLQKHKEYRIKNPKKVNWTESQNRKRIKYPKGWIAMKRSQRLSRYSKKKKEKKRKIDMMEKVDRRGLKTLLSNRKNKQKKNVALLRVAFFYCSYGQSSRLFKAAFYSQFDYLCHNHRINYFTLSRHSFEILSSWLFVIPNSDSNATVLPLKSLGPFKLARF